MSSKTFLKTLVRFKGFFVWQNKCKGNPWMLLFSISSQMTMGLPIFMNFWRSINCITIIWAPSSEFVSSSSPSWQILTAHAQTFRGARDLAFCLKVPLDSLLVWASSEGSGETARMHRLAWTFAARIGDKYQIRLARPICNFFALKTDDIVRILTGNLYSCN